ncbi:MAG TPA: histidinol-phosphate transaminase [Anaerolineae bacterium]|nr:histidinol-phosphate transaminase [Anaerolineae bacterium]
MDVKSLFSPHIERLEAYEPPDWETVAARAGRSPGQLIRLDANENPYGPSPRAVDALGRFEGYGLYPDYQALTQAVAAYAETKPENLVLGNGGDEIIDLAVRLFLAPGEGAIVCPPAFSMYAISTEAHRGQVLSVPRRDDFSLDVEGIEALAQRGEPDVRPKLLFATSPGNPDGRTIPAEIIERLLKLPLAVIVDEAYIEFGGETVVPLLADHANLLVLRTFSKWAGMAGLRLGYAVTSPEIAGAMARLRPPYNVNAAAVVAALATFEDMAHTREAIVRLVAERDRLHRALAALPGVAPLPSQANFVFCRLQGRSAQEVTDALAEQGILVRSFSAPNLADAVRITVGQPDQNNAFLDALQSILGVQSPTPMTQYPVPESRAETRRAQVHRRTGETTVAVSLDLDGTGRYQVDTGLGFLDHMLAQIAAHGLFDLTVQARGDLEVDEHHTVEDVAIGLGQALDRALGERRGLVRMGHAYAPLDEALARVVVDLSGRPYAVIEAEFATPALGAVGTDLIIHFLETLAFQARMSLHAQVLHGRNDHHKAEALFKALGRALDAATRQDPRRQSIPSTKGVL